MIALSRLQTFSFSSR